MTNIEKRLEEFVYQVKRNKECQVVLDHNPIWCGDCFACSECGKIFITASAANASIYQAEQSAIQAAVDALNSTMCGEKWCTEVCLSVENCGHVVNDQIVAEIRKAITALLDKEIV